MERLGRLLIFAAKETRTEFESLLAEHGSSLPQFILMNALHAREHPSQRELADATGIHGPTITHHLTRLEADGLISRDRDAGDRRVVRVALTAAGRRVHRRARGVADRHDAALRSWLGADDAEALERILNRVRTRIAEASHVT